MAAPEPITARRLLDVAHLERPPRLKARGTMRLLLSGPGGGDWVLDYHGDPLALTQDGTTAECAIHMTADTFVRQVRGLTVDREAYRRNVRVERETIEALPLPMPTTLTLAVDPACTTHTLILDSLLQPMFGDITQQVRDYCESLPACVDSVYPHTAACEVDVGQGRRLATKLCQTEFDATLTCGQDHPPTCRDGKLVPAAACKSVFARHEHCRDSLPRGFD